MERRPATAEAGLAAEDDGEEEEEEEEEVRSPVASPVFHFSEDKENTHTNPNSGESEAAGGQQAGEREAEAAKPLSTRNAEEATALLQQAGQTQWRAEDGRPV